jgi:putative toxin-antitoxin system antitoxin component (TIGR02293 family)
VKIVRILAHIPNGPIIVPGGSDGIAEIMEVLGGNKTFKHPIRSTDELAEQVRSGLPASTVTLLAATLSLQRAQVAERLSIPPRTLSRRLATKSRLTHEEWTDAAHGHSGRTRKGSSWIRREGLVWMSKPNRALGGPRPFDQLDTEPGIRSVEEILHRIAYGMYS